MILLKYIPSILKDEGRIAQELPFVADKTLQEYLAETGFELNESKVIVTGEVAKDFSATLKDGDEVIVTPEIKIPAAFFVWLGFSAATAATLAGISVAVGWALTILSLAYSIYSYCQKPKTPNFGTTGDGLDEGSPTYGWDGITNTQDVGVPIPVVYGEHRVGGNIINQFIRTDGDKEYLNMLLALSEGEIESIDSIEINQNPSTNFDGIILTKRYGTNAQAQIANFNDSHDLKTLSVNLTQNNAYVYTTVNTDITAFELKLTCVGGLFQQGSGGALESWAVTYKVEYKLHTDGSYIDLGSTTIDGKSRTDLRRVFRKADLVAGQYDIRITRTSDDSSLDPMRQGDLYFKGVDEIAQDEPLIYPNLALLGVEALATDQLNGSTPTITSLVKGRKVSIPAVLTALGGDAVAWDLYYWDSVNSLFKLLADNTALYWDGATYTTAYSANPIWCLKDLLSNTRYGLGDYITTSMMDTTQLLEMALYCEENVSDGDGGYEKRFRMDVVIDSSTKAIDMITQLAGTFRCFTFYSGGAIKLKIDKAESPVQMFGMGNIISESFIQSWKSIKEIPNVIEVQFMNKDFNYKQETIAVMDEVSIAAGDPIRKKSLRLFCTRISQAVREGKYALNVAKCIQRTVTLKAGIDAIACQAGDIINVAHDVPQWGFSGRVQEGSTTTKVKLDQPITITAGKTYKIRVRFADDTQVEKTVSDEAGTYTEVNVSSAFANAPASYDVYSFGEENKVVAPYRIISMRRAENSEVEIIALEYDADVYDTDTILLPDNNYSALSFTIPPVENLTLTESVITLNDGSIENAIDVWFTKPLVTGYVLKRYNRARIYLSDNAGASYSYRGETTAESFKIQGGLINATYKVLVVSVSDSNVENARSASPSASITLVGKDSNPNDVTNFVYTFLNALVFAWDKNTDKDLLGYEIRDANSNWGVQNANLIYRGLANTFTVVAPASRAPATYYICAFDTSGNYSATPASVTPTNAAPSAPSIAATQWFGYAKIEWTDSVDTDLRYYEVYKSNTNAWAGEETLEARISGKMVTVQGNAPVDAVAASPDSTSITDAALIGKGVNYFVGDVLLQTSGTYIGQEAIVTAFNNATGQVSVASWPSGTPTALDKFVIKDRAYYKVRGADTYGPGNFSSAVTINFTPLTASEIGDAIISARKLIAGELITLSAQIKDLIVTNAKISDLDGGKITAQSITLSKLASEAVPPKTYYQDDAPTTGMNEGDYWIDTNDSNKLYVYQSSAWVVISQSGGGGGITVFKQAAIPVSLSIADLWIDTDDSDKLYRAASVGADQIASGEWELINAATATGWAHGSDITKIDGGKIYTDSITADKINVNQLDALSTNTGTLTVDESISVGAGRIVIDGANNIIKVYDNSANLRVELGDLP